MPDRDRIFSLLFAKHRGGWNALDRHRSQHRETLARGAQHRDRVLYALYTPEHNPYPACSPLRAGNVYNAVARWARSYRANHHLGRRSRQDYRSSLPEGARCGGGNHSKGPVMQRLAEKACPICHDTNGEHKPGYRCYPSDRQRTRLNDFMDTAELGFDSVGMIQYFKVREAALEAARLLQGNIPQDERDDDHFWNLFGDAFPLIDPQDLPPRVAPLSSHG